MRVVDCMGEVRSIVKGTTFPANLRLASELSAVPSILNTNLCQLLKTAESCFGLITLKLVKVCFPTWLTDATSSFSLLEKSWRKKKNRMHDLSPLTMLTGSKTGVQSFTGGFPDCCWALRRCVTPWFHPGLLVGCENNAIFRCFPRQASYCPQVQLHFRSFQRIET